MGLPLLETSGWGPLATVSAMALAALGPATASAQETRGGDPWAVPETTAESSEPAEASEPAASPPMPEIAGETYVYIRTSSEDVAPLWVTEARFAGAPDQDTIYPDAAPGGAPCVLRLPNGRYELSLGRWSFSAAARGGLQVWDVEPRATWALTLGIVMDVVGAALLAALMVLPLAAAFEGARSGDSDPPSDATETGLGVAGGLLLLGSVPFYIYYASTGSSSMALDDPTFDLGGGVGVTPGAIVLPWQDGTAAFALNLSGTWGRIPTPRARRHRGGS